MRDSTDLSHDRSSASGGDVSSVGFRGGLRFGNGACAGINKLQEERHLLFSSLILRVHTCAARELWLGSS